MRTYVFLFLPIFYFYFLLQMGLSTFPKFAKAGDVAAPEVKSERKRRNVPPSVKAHGDDLVGFDIVQNAFEKHDMRFPPNHGRGPVLVRAAVKVLSVPLFREEDFRMVLKIKLSQKWQDERLNFNTSSIIDLPPYLAHEMWQPNVAFEETHSSIHTVFQFHQYHHIHENGTVVHTSHLTISSHCPLFLQDYPLDRRRCRVSFGSASYSTKTVVYEWDDMQFPLKFRKVALQNLTNWNFPLCTLNSSIEKTEEGTEFSKVFFELLAVRNATHVIKSFFIPPALLVICSWIPTYLKDNHSARIISGVAVVGATMALVLREPFGSSQNYAYDTYYDYFRFACLLLVILNLWQSGVYVCLKNREMLESNEERDRTGVQGANNRREAGCKGAYTPLRQRICQSFSCFKQRRSHETGRERDVEAALSEQESPVVRHSRAQSIPYSSKWDTVCHILTPIVTFIVLGAIMLLAVVHRNSDIPGDASWRAPVLDLLESNENRGI